MFRQFAQKIIPHIAFVLIAILMLDNYVLPKRDNREVVDNGSIDVGRKPKYKDFYLITKDGNKYRVTEYHFNTILIDQEIGVYRTLLFRRPVKMSWCEADGGCYIQHIGAFIPGAFEFIMLGGLCLVSLLSASGILKIHWINNYVLLFLSAGALAYYFVY